MGAHSRPSQAPLGWDGMLAVRSPAPGEEWAFGTSDRLAHALPPAIWFSRAYFWLNLLRKRFVLQTIVGKFIAACDFFLSGFYPPAIVFSSSAEKFNSKWAAKPSRAPHPPTQERVSPAPFCCPLQGNLQLSLAPLTLYTAL